MKIRKKLLFSLSIMVICATVLLPISGCSSIQGAAQSTDQLPTSQTVTIGLTYIPNVQFSPAYVAKEDGIYSNAGIKAKLRHHGSDEDLFTAVATGQEDVVIASGDEVFAAREQGLDLVSIGAYYRKYPVTIIVPEDSSIQSVTDLSGKKIGLPGEYGSSYYGFLAALDSSGMSKDSVTLMSIGYTQQAALTQGQVDAVVGFSNNDLIQFQQSHIKVRTLDIDVSQIPLVSASIVTTHKWLDEHHELASSFIQATTAGISRVIENPQRAIEVTQKYDTTLTDTEHTTAARAVLDATAKLLAPDGKVLATQDIDKWKKMSDFQHKIGILGSEVDVSGAVTNDCAVSDK